MEREVKMEKKTKKYVSLLLAALLCSGAFVSCSEDDTQENVNEMSVGEESTAVETEPETDEFGREAVAYPLEEGLDFGGYDIRLVSRQDPRWSIDFGVDELTGDLVNDAVYNRNIDVESRINVVFTRLTMPDTNTTTTEAVGDAVVQDYLAGDNAYDIAAFYQAYGGSVMATSGALRNMLTVPYVNFENPWWNNSFTEALTIYDQLYYVIGDMNISVTSMLMGVFFNQKLFEDSYGDHHELYDLVRQNAWTFDRFQEYVSGQWRDTNGDGQQDMDDVYGLVTAEDDKGPWLAAFDVHLCTKDESGLPRLSFFSERTVDAFNLIYKFYLENPDVYFGAKGYNYAQTFSNEMSLFAICKFAETTSTLRDMESPYGVLPMPMYDETQNGYYNTAHDNSNLMGVVQNTRNVEAVGAALELLNYYSYLTVNPAYFEIAMKSKYFADSDSAEMFDIIRDGTFVDFGQIYTLAIGGGTYEALKTYHVLARNMIRQRMDNLASQYKANETLYETCLNEILEQYRELGNVK